MMKTEDVSALAGETVLQLPGIVATKTGLVVFESATEPQLQKAFGQIAKMNVSLAWWLGDLGLALQERKQRQLAKEAAALRTRANECTTDDAGMDAKRQLLERAEKIETRGVIEYTRDLCAAHDISEGHVKDCVMLARFYQPSERSDGLSPHHHNVAMVAAGGAKGDRTKAKQWLSEAKEQALSASELRKMVNLSRALPAEQATPPEPQNYEELVSADAWAMGFKGDVTKLSQEQAIRLYTLMQGLRELADALKERIAATA